MTDHGGLVSWLQGRPRNLQGFGLGFQGLGVSGFRGFGVFLRGWFRGLGFLLGGFSDPGAQGRWALRRSLEPLFLWTSGTLGSIRLGGVALRVALVAGLGGAGGLSCWSDSRSG